MGYPQSFVRIIELAKKRIPLDDIPPDLSQWRLIAPNLFVYNVRIVDPTWQCGQ
jgi:hypothetical protein